MKILHIIVCLDVGGAETMLKRLIESDPESIPNTRVDPGSPFSSEAFTESLSSRGIAISMDSRGQWRDNVIIERLWKSVKYEDIYLKAYGSIVEVKKGLTEYFAFYNQKRWHQSLDRKTPAMVYFNTTPQRQVAA